MSLSLACIGHETAQRRLAEFWRAGILHTAACKQELYHRVYIKKIGEHGISQCYCARNITHLENGIDLISGPGVPIYYGGNVLNLMIWISIPTAIIYASRGYFLDAMYLSAGNWSDGINKFPLSLPISLGTDPQPKIGSGPFNNTVAFLIVLAMQVKVQKCIKNPSALRKHQRSLVKFTAKLFRPL